MHVRSAAAVRLPEAVDCEGLRNCAGVVRPSTGARSHEDDRASGPECVAHESCDDDEKNDHDGATGEDHDASIGRGPKP